MEKKLLATIVLVTVASLSIAGCLSSLSSNQASPSAAGAVSPSVSASPSATPSATPSNAPSPTVTPPADVYQVVVSGPTNTQYGLTWTATVYKNGVPIPQDQLTNQVTWFVNGQPGGGLQGPSGPNSVWPGYGPGTMTHDANGLAGSPFQHTNVITAVYKGVTSQPAYFVDPEIGPVATPVPTATPFPTPTATPTPTPTRTPVTIRI
jgi:hypothetical protein